MIRSGTALALLGAAGLGSAAGGMALDDGELAASCVAACIFWGGLSLGSLALLMIHQLTGGAWGEELRRPLLGAVGTLPVLIALLAPLLVTPERWYPWARTDGAPAAVPLPIPAWYLNVPWFRARALLYLLLWLALAWLLGAWGGRSAAVSRHARRISAGGLIALIATTSLAAFDWVMSLDPQWYSAVFGLLVGTGQVSAALALVVLWRLAASGESNPAAERLHDFGNLLLTLVLLWTYLLFMQFLTIWIADQPREIRWYLPRLQSDWRWLGTVILTLHLFVLLPLLLSRAAKRVPAGVGLIAVLLLCAQALYALWLTLPTLRPEGFGIGATDLAWFAGAGAVWLAVFLWRSALAPLPPPAGARTGELT